jgi:hypothetical protein
VKHREEEDEDVELVQAVDGDERHLAGHFVSMLASDRNLPPCCRLLLV